MAMGSSEQYGHSILATTTPIIVISRPCFPCIDRSIHQVFSPITIEMSDLLYPIAVCIYLTSYISFMDNIICLVSCWDNMLVLCGQKGKNSLKGGLIRSCGSLSYIWLHLLSRRRSGPRKLLPLSGSHYGARRALLAGLPLNDVV